MINFQDENIHKFLTETDGGACDFCDNHGYSRGYSVFIQLEDTIPTEVIFSERELKKMLKAIKEEII